jgi:hypothetical protein
MPQLEEFYFQYHDELDHESDYRTYFNNRDRFTSSFWMEEKWVFEAEMDSFEIIYSIRPYKYIVKKKFSNKNISFLIVEKDGMISILLLNFLNLLDLF